MYDLNKIKDEINNHILNLVKKNKNLILISNTIKYFVKSNEEEYLEEQLEYGDYYKIFINGTNPFIYLHYFLLLLRTRLIIFF